MVKKRLASGEACRKCVQAEDLLRGRGLWGLVDEVVWAEEGNSDSPGAVLARAHSVSVAPFFLISDGGQERVETSALRIAKLLAKKDETTGVASLGELASSLAGAHPTKVLRAAWDAFGKDCLLAFSGAEDVVLLAMAHEVRAQFPVCTLDTGRLHPETLGFVEQARLRYGFELISVSPQAAAVEALVRKKGLFSFYDEGHKECCGIRKVAPLRRVLSGYQAWINGRRPDQNPSTRSAMAPVEEDEAFQGSAGPLYKFNPLASWTGEAVWQFIRDEKIPYNPLHDRGFRSIGCAPCTRAVLPDQHERDGRWWWESDGKRECGLHWPGDEG